MKTTGDMLFDTMAIFGVGLIGGSLGMAAKRYGAARRVIGIGRSEQRLMHAKILGAIDEYTTDQECGAADADVVFVCTPVRSVVSTLKHACGCLKYGAIVTDVGSTKREIVSDSVTVLPKEIRFIGGHPMAGSEQAGVEAAIPDLFRNATYVLTPVESTDVFALQAMSQFIERIGARCVVMSPGEHDETAAIISHLPHIIASSLLQQAEAANKKSGKTFSLAAGSFRDLTRIAGSPPEIWRDVCMTNPDAIIESIEAFQNHLENFRNALLECNEEKLLKFFQNGNHIREVNVTVPK